MSRFLLIKPPEKIDATLTLGPSKSIGNRLFIISALAGKIIALPQNSSADLVIMRQALLNDSSEINVGESGTALRFLIAYYSLKGKDVRIAGKGRLHERTVGPLVDALRSLGAKISYEKKEGFAPVMIHASGLRGGKVKLDVSKSSQFVSALLLIAPYLEKGLEIEQIGDAVSVPYTELTISLMKMCGAKLKSDENIITVSSGKYKVPKIDIESDWSAAAFWYQAMALHRDARITIHGLAEKSFQGDQYLTELFSRMGVKSHFENTIHNLILEAGQRSTADATPHIDLRNYPDLAPSVVLTCAELFNDIRITGLETLTTKESNRIEALLQGLTQCAYIFKSDNKSFIHLKGKSGTTKYSMVIDSHCDHRIAMAFAMMSIVFGEIIISDPDCVDKSYPGFWDDMKNAGFRIKETELRTSF